MSCVYFIRHGQSEWNVLDKICGSTDVPLTDEGRKQAAETGRKFVELGYSADEIIYSPLMRAAETAKIISEITGIPARPEPRITEQNFGKWEGTSPRNAVEFSKAKQNFVDDFEGGESMMKLAQRIYNVLDELKAQAPEKTYVIVAHNGIARVVKSYFESMSNEEYAKFAVKNCEILRFDL